MYSHFDLLSKGGPNVFQLFLVLFLVVATIIGIPLLFIGYDRGLLKVPKWIFYILVFGGITIAAILEFPLENIEKSPASLPEIIIIYCFLGYILQRVYTRKNFIHCVAIMLIANCVGIFVKYLILTKGMSKYEPTFHFFDIILFLIVTHAIALVAYFTTSGKKQN